MKFNVFSEYVEVEDGYSGEVEVEYLYYVCPETNADPLILPPQFTEYIMAVGAAAEYFYRSSLIDEALFFRNRFESGVNNLSRSGIPDLIGVVHNTFKTGNDFDREFELDRTGGNLTLWIRGGILMVNDRRCLWLAAADITRMKKLESYRSDFVANVSHEIKTPLTSIIGAAEALEGFEDGAEDSPRRKLLDILINQSRRLNLLVQDILSLASLETRQMTPARDFELLELDSVIINAVNMSLARSGGNCGIEIKVTADAALKVNGDSQLLEQAVVNLIDKAVKYSAASGIEVSLKEEDGYAVIGVLDNGVGIPPEHQRRIFERFYRVHKERSRQSGGTGLGLAIVKHIAQLHNGFVRLVSTPGHGCGFYIHIPLQK